MSLLLRKLRLLTRLTTPGAADILHLYSPTTGKDHYVQLTDLLDEGGYADWDSTSAANGDYDIDSKVTYGFKLWKSLINNNNVVPTEGASWTEVSPTVVSAGITRTTVVTTGGTITCNLASLREVVFVGGSSFAAIKTWALSNTANGHRITIMFNMTGLFDQTFPSNFIMSDARWNSGTKKWTPLDTGKYKALATYDGTNWNMDIDGPYT